MVRLADLAAARAILDVLAEGEEPWIVLLPRQPGRKERRYAHLLGDEITVDETGGDMADHAAPSGSDATRSSLERRVAVLEAELASLRDRIAALESDRGAELRSRPAQPIGEIPGSGID